MLVLLRHGISMRSGYVSMRFILHFTQKTYWVNDYNKYIARSQSRRQNLNWPEDYASSNGTYVDIRHLPEDILSNA